MTSSVSVIPRWIVAFCAVSFPTIAIFAAFAGDQENARHAFTIGIVLTCIVYILRREQLLEHERSKNPKQPNVRNITQRSDVRWERILTMKPPRVTHSFTLLLLLFVGGLLFGHVGLLLYETELWLLSLFCFVGAAVAFIGTGLSYGERLREQDRVRLWQLNVAINEAQRKRGQPKIQLLELLELIKSGHEKLVFAKIRYGIWNLGEIRRVVDTANKHDREERQKIQAELWQEQLTQEPRDSF